MKINHVPSLGLRYWLALSLASVFGANMGDCVAHILGWGHVFGLVPLAALFGVVILIERRSDKSTEAYYWLAIVTMRTAATNLSDLANHDLHFDPQIVIILLALALGAVVLVWRPKAPPQAGDAPEELTARQITADARYWTAMLIAGVLGTAMGDYAADDMGLDLGIATALTVPVLAAALLVQNLRGWNAGPTYWIIIVIVRTAGTNVGDWLASRHGLKLGLPVSTPLTALMLLVLLLTWQDKTLTAIRGRYLAWTSTPGPDEAQPGESRSPAQRRSPLLAPIVLAATGWLMFGAALVYAALQQTGQHSHVQRLEDQNRDLAADLKKAEAAAGSLSDIEARQATAQAALAATQQAALDAEQALHDVEARTAQDHDAAVTAAAQDAIKAVRAAEEEAVRERDAALKATADAKAEHDRLLAETAAAQQSLKALQQSQAALGEDIAVLKSRHGYLVQQAADLQSLLAGLAATREEAAKAVDEANIERDRIAGEAVSIRQDNSVLQAQLAATKVDLAAGAARLANLQEQFQISRKNIAEQVDLLKQMAASRDAIAQQIAQHRSDLAHLGAGADKPLASLQAPHQQADAVGPGTQPSDVPAAVVKKPDSVGETPVSRDASMCFNWDTHAPCRIDQ